MVRTQHSCTGKVGTQFGPNALVQVRVGTWCEPNTVVHFLITCTGMGWYMVWT